MEYCFTQIKNINNICAVLYLKRIIPQLNNLPNSINMKTIFTIILCVISVSVYAQDADTLAAPKKDTTYWKKSFRGALNFNQAAFSQNWSGGGINSVGFNSTLYYKANYKKGRNSWNNELDFAFGFVNNAGQGNRKSMDRIFIDTKYGYKVSKSWDVALSLNFQSQFANGYKYEEDQQGDEQEILISRFMAPGYITSALGIEFHPKDYFKIRVSPFSPRVTIVNDKELYLTVPNNYGVEIGKTSRWEWLAMQIMADFDKDLTETINLKMRYQLFANYEQFRTDEMDQRFEVAITTKITKYINVKLSGMLLYDKDQDGDIQSNQGMGVGFIYTFKNYKEDK